MSALKKIALVNMLLGGSLPYKFEHSDKSTNQKSKRKEAKPLAKVIYYTDENGQIKRKTEYLEGKK